MEVTYELTPEDVWQYNLYYRRHKAVIRPVFLYSLAVIAGIIYAGAIAVVCDSWLKFHQPEWPMLFYLAAMPFFVFRFLPATKRRIIKFHSQRPGLFCVHTITLSPEWFGEKSPVNETKLAWTTIQAIEENQAYFFLFTSKSVAHTVPKRAFTRQREAQLFVDTARRYLDAAKTRTPTTAEDVAVWPPAPRPGA